MALYSSPNGEQQEAAKPPAPPGSQADTMSTWSGLEESSGNLWGTTNALEIKAVADNLIHKDGAIEDGKDRHGFLQDLCKAEERLYKLAKLVKTRMNNGTTDVVIIKTIEKMNLTEEKFHQLVSEGRSFLSEQMVSEAEKSADENNRTSLIVWKWRNSQQNAPI